MKRLVSFVLCAAACGGSDSTTTTTHPPPPNAVLTYHNDNGRTGAYLAEKTLTPGAIASRGMTLAVTRPVDRGLNAQILYVPDLVVAGAHHAVIYAATLGNTVFAYDANDTSATGTEAGLLWKTKLTDPVEPARMYARGIMSTPAIDLDANEIYVVYGTKDTLDEPSGENDVDLAFFLVALDLATGEVKRHVLIGGSYPKNGGTVEFLARNHRQRPGLLLSKGSIYVAFGTRHKEELIDYHGWVMRYDARSFAAKGAWCATPNNVPPLMGAGPAEGAGIWQGGAGLTGDAAGDVYFITGNAVADPSTGSYGNAFVKLHPNGNRLDVAASFTPYDPLHLLEKNDVDLGSGGAILLPGVDRLVGGGKTGILYLLEARDLAEVQELQAFHDVYDPAFQVDSDWEGGPHLHAAPAYWSGPDPGVGWIYDWSEQDYLKAFRYDVARGMIDADHPVVGNVLALEAVMPGGMLSVSADENVAGTGVVWTLLPKSDIPDPRFGELPGRFIAWDAETLDKLWETDVPTLPKWMPPTIAEGKVFVSTSSRELRVYTLGP